MKLNEALDRYNEGNPIAQWIRKQAPPGYFNRQVLLGGILITIGMVMLWNALVSEPYILCTDRAGCIHPTTGSFVPHGYEEGTPLGTQIADALGWAAGGLFVTLGLNHLAYRKVNR